MKIPINTYQSVDHLSGKTPIVGEFISRSNSSKDSK